MRIVFMGTPDYATAILKEILDAKIEVAALVTMPDKPVGRKMEIKPPHIKEYVLQRGCDFPIFQPHTLKDVAFQERIKEIDPDFLVVAAYGKILPKEILDIATPINLHASILPQYRGASPIQESILNKDEFFGITAMRMDVGLDTGEILGTRYIKNKSQRIDVIWETLSIEAGKLAVKILNNYENLKALPQNDCNGSYCKKIDKKAGEVNLDSAMNLYTKYLAYSGWPGVFFSDGTKLKEVTLLDSFAKANNIGEIVSVQKGSFDLACAQGIVRIHKIQPQSKNEMDGESYLRGRRLGLGDTLF